VCDRIFSKGRRAARCAGLLEAACIRGVSRQAIASLINHHRVETFSFRDSRLGDPAVPGEMVLRFDFKKP
jgi:hypothetical protein